MKVKQQNIGTRNYYMRLLFDKESWRFVSRSFPENFSNCGANVFEAFPAPQNSHQYFLKYKKEPGDG
jgi:hypothetical protein